MKMVKTHEELQFSAPFFFFRQKTRDPLPVGSPQHSVPGGAQRSGPSGRGRCHVSWIA